MNSVGRTAPQAIPQRKVDGRTHCRKDELAFYRESLPQASIRMTIAADEGDFERANFWSKRIDIIQAKIHEIIDQEDKHSYAKSEKNADTVKLAIDSAGKVVDMAGEAVSVADKVIGVEDKAIKQGWATIAKFAKVPTGSNLSALA